MVEPLIWYEATADDLPMLQAMNFGSQPFETEIADWLNLEASEFIRHKDNVIWVYRTRNGDCVGFTSLTTTHWDLARLGGPPVEILYIPALGIDKKFHSVGAGKVPFIHRYPGQMLNQLIDEATNRKQSKNRIGLITHLDNDKAAGIYQSKFGFKHLPGHHFEDGNPGKPYHRWTRTI